MLQHDLDQINTWLARGERVAVATVVQTIGSAPQQAGAKLFVTTGGAMAGSVSGGCIEATLAKRLARLSAEGFSEQELARIHGPIGLAIGAKTPEEIALSILAQIVAVQRKA